MIIAVIIGRKYSKGFPGKNLHKVLGRPLAFYPIKAAKDCLAVDRIFLSTDDPGLKKLAIKNGIEVIERPPQLCSDKALGEDAFVHAYRIVKQEYQDKKIELIVLLMCNAASITSEMISEGIRILRKNPQYDSAVTVSKYNMWSPLRARKIGRDGLLYPFVPFETFGSCKILTCDRDSGGDVWFADMGASIVRPRCLENIKEGLLPQRWMGKKIYPLKQWGGCDVDFEWQIPMVEFWIKKNIRKRKK
jgi:hypothetical protein